MPPSASTLLTSTSPATSSSSNTARDHLRWDIVATRLAVRGMDKGVTAAAIADQLELSYRHFLTTFRDKTGMTFGAWYTAAKVRRAQRLLLQGKTVEKAAEATGYSDPSGLRRAFLQVVGCTPKAWISHNR